MIVSQTAKLMVMCVIVMMTGRSSADANSSVANIEAPVMMLDLTIEELMRVPVTSVSKRAEPWFEAASAVYVITSEDIRRSGATSIPEALRLAPGVHVARVDAHTWAISVRGFNSMFSDKLLVLIDGRAVYTPLFAGVFWDVQDTLLEDIDRIEVIRGPGATLWGANAVNGVINIITKSAPQTQGGTVSGGAGTEDQGFTSFRYGGRINDKTHYRVYGKWFTRDDGVFSDGTDGADNWYQGRGGFRIDWEPTGDDLLTLQGDIYGSNEGQTYRADPENPATEFSDAIHANGGNFLGRWTRRLDAKSELTVQTYYDRTDRDLEQFVETRDTFDIEMDHRFALGSWNSITWGLGYRLTSNDVEDTATIMWDNDGLNLQLFSGFIQDQIAIVPHKLLLTLGSKFEHNDFTGFEVQPSARVSWTPTSRQTFWGAISRAVRTPAQSDRDMKFTVDTDKVAGLPLVFFGNDQFDTEEVVVYELGYRVQPTDRVTMDLALFYNVYDDLRSLENKGVSIDPLPPHIRVEVDNLLGARTYGFELAGTWQAMPWWRWQATYAYIRLDIDPAATSTDTEREEGDVPRHTIMLRSTMDLPGHFEFDTGLRYVDALATQDVPSYLVVDVRLGWRPNPRWELSVVGQNLLDSQHPEFASLFTVQRTEVEHSVYGRVTMRF
jgi:iron complex outermembrane receptor protein